MSERRRMLVGFGLEVPLVLALTLLDAFVGIGFPATAYLFLVVYVVVMLPWMMEGRFLWQLAARDIPPGERSEAHKQEQSR